MADNPRVRFGLMNVHYAIITENEDGTITYSKPKRMKGAVNLVLTAKGDKGDFYADNSLYYVSHANQGYDGTLELAIVQDDFKIEVLGHKKDANGVLFENTNAIPNKIALLFEICTDKSRRRFVFYNIDVSR